MSANSGAETAPLVAGLYNAAWSAVVAACRPAWWLDCVRGQPASWLAGKLGLQPAATERSRCWIHACSVGEVAVALRCMDALRTARPGLVFTLTTVTPEGHQLATARVAAPDAVEWFPFDARNAMRRTFDRLRPEFVILVEVELWPNHLREAEARGIPVFVINARLTASEAGRYRLAGEFMRRTFAIPRLVCAQTPEDATLFAALGATEVRVTGNLKFDASSAPHPREETNAARLILLGASTHDGEEEILLELLTELRGKFPDLALILAPRHPQRAEKVAALAGRRGLSMARSSAARADVNRDCLVVDTIGDLPGLFAQATVAFIGKSLTARGGQNFLEAVEAGCPVVFGPHMENFRASADLFLRADAVRQVATRRELGLVVEELLGHAEERRALAERATELLGGQRGATNRTVELILTRLANRPAFTDPLPRVRQQGA